MHMVSMFSDISIYLFLLTLIMYSAFLERAAQNDFLFVCFITRIPRIKPSHSTFGLEHFPPFLNINFLYIAYPDIVSSNT